MGRRRSVIIAAAVGLYLGMGTHVGANLQYVCSYDVICWGWDGPYCYDETWYEDCEWQDDGAPPPDDYGGGPGNPDVTLQITNATIVDNVVVIHAGGAGFSGRMVVTAIRDGSQQTILSDENRGTGDHYISFMRDSLPVGTYNAVEATWYANGMQLHTARTVAFRVLGDYRHSQYNTPAESTCNGSKVDCTIATDTKTCGTYTGRLKTGFIGRLDLNGSGLSESYGLLQISGSCSDTSDYTQIHVLNGASGPVNDSTVAANPNHPHLSYRNNDQVMIINAPNWFKTITDRCPACVEAQLDNYTTNGACYGDGDVGNFRTIRLR